MNIEWLKTALDAIGVTKKLQDSQALVYGAGIPVALERFGMVAGDPSAGAINAAALLNAITSIPDAGSLIATQGGIYYIDGVAFPDKEFNLFLNGSTLKKVSGVENRFVLAPSVWSTNKTYVGKPFRIYNGVIDGSDITTVANVIRMNWNSQYDGIESFKSLGHGFLDTAANSADINITTTAVNNNIYRCIARNNAGTGFKINDPQRNKMTDMILAFCRAYGNGAYGFDIQPGAGTVLQDPQTYANASGGVLWRSASIGTRHIGGYHDDSTGGGVIIQEVFSPFAVVNSQFKNCNLVGNFGSGGGSNVKNIYSIGNQFDATSRIRHEFFDPNFIIHSIGDCFASSVPLEWSNGSSTGIINASRSWVIGLGKYIDGVQRTLVGTYSPRTLEWGTAAPTAGLHGRGSRVLLIDPTAGGTEGFVCTAGGTPGTWKSFGSIAA